MSTKAIIITRTSSSNDKAFSSLVPRLDHYKKSANHPLFLAFVAAVDAIYYVDRCFQRQVDGIRHVEEQTGFSPFHLGKPLNHHTTEEELLELSEMSRTASSILVSVADMTQHLQCVRVVLEALTQKQTTWKSAIPEETKALIENTDQDISQASLILHSHVESDFEYADYLRERARNQLAVVCPLYISLKT